MENKNLLIKAWVSNEVIDKSANKKAINPTTKKAELILKFLLANIIEFFSVVVVEFTA